MYYQIILISIFSFILTSCSPTIQNNGMSEIKFNKIIIETGKTSKNDLIRKYGPPEVELRGEAKKLALRKGIKKISVSLSDTDELAVAVAQAIIN